MPLPEGRKYRTNLPPGQAAKPPPRHAPSVRIGTLRVASGHVNFTDNFVEPNYTADLTALSGTVTGISTSDAKPAQVAISGSVNRDGPLEIQGSVGLLAEPRSLDLRATARDIELTKLTPYAVRWAGYTIESGTLSAVVHYEIEGGRLEAENRFVLQKLELGERVPSADAPDLPLELALSLLRDRDGTVTLNLPINGSLADPQFSVAGLIGQALAALVRRIATAPFALLASLAGPGGDEDASREAAGRADAAIGAGHAGSSGNPGKADSAVDRRQADATAGARKAEVDLSLIRFPPGSADIGNGQRRTLQRLAQGLARRPGLQLDIAGYADRASDRQALQAAATASTDKAGETRERQADPRPRPRRGRARTP